MQKVDYKRELSHLYRPSPKKVELVDVPEMMFIQIDGAGDPNDSVQFQDAVEALFAISYTLKFMVKKSHRQIDYGVMPLEGLWWADDMTSFTTEDRTIWQWTLMIMQPNLVDRTLFEDACAAVQRKKDPAALSLARFQPIAEGQVAQIMHLGPFSQEGPTVARVHDFIDAQGYVRRGKHHEIYLSDIRRAAPEKWKTVIRQPVMPRNG